MKTIKLPRNIGIKKARKLYDAAVKVMEGGPDCCMDFSRVRRIDLSTAQVVIALERECGRRGGRLVIKGSNEIAARLLGLAGVKSDILTIG